MVLFDLYLFKKYYKELNTKLCAYFLRKHVEKVKKKSEEDSREP